MADKPTKTPSKPTTLASTPVAKAASQPPTAQAAANGHEHKTHSFRRRLLGKVVSDKMDKTVVVEVVRRARHTVYKKYVRNRDQYKAHDEQNEFKVGDRVEIMEHRPISKGKRWKVIRLIARAVEE